jgi:hypothetical protein
MSETTSATALRRCVFCRMPTPIRFLRVPMCGICRDQAYDFLWASGVQAALVAFGLISGLTFLAEEVLLFAVLVIVKHRVHPPWLPHAGCA